MIDHEDEEELKHTGGGFHNEMDDDLLEVGAYEDANNLMDEQVNEHNDEYQDAGEQARERHRYRSNHHDEEQEEVQEGHQASGEDIIDKLLCKNETID